MLEDNIFRKLLKKSHFMNLDAPVFGGGGVPDGEQMAEVS